MPDATRTFNGLTGAEIRTRLLQELEARLRDDTRLGAHLVFPVVTWTWRLEPGGLPPAGGGGGGGRVVFRVVTWTWRLELEASPPAGAVGPGADGVLRAEVRGRIGMEGGP